MIVNSPILGGDYTTLSPFVVDNRLVNLYPELVQEGGKSPAFLNRCPAMQLKFTALTGPIRGLFEVYGGLYCVSGNTFGKFQNNEFVQLGVVNGEGPVTLEYNPTQIAVCCNPDVFIYTIVTNEFQRVTAPYFNGGTSICFSNGYFIASNPNSQLIQYSNKNNGLIWEALDFIQADASPDRCVCVKNLRSEIWAFGTDSLQVFTASGGQSAFTVLPGSQSEIGTTSKDSVCLIENNFYWLGKSPSGSHRIYTHDGYIPIAVSTPQLETLISIYSGLEKVYAYGYTQAGHTFYILTFPDANITWCYDITTQEWHQRAGFEDGQYVAHLGTCAVNYSNEVLVGGKKDGSVYVYKIDDFENNAEFQKWERTWRAVFQNLNKSKPYSVNYLQIEIEPAPSIKLEPIVELSVSDNGGKTWNNPIQLSLGKIGEYAKRIITRRLGVSRQIHDRVFKLTGSDACVLRIVDAIMDVS